MAISLYKDGVGTVRSLGKTKDYELIPDDRQELVQTIGGAVVEDYGVVEAGDVVRFSATFSAADYVTLRNFWRNRTKVLATLDDGTEINDARVVIKRVQYADDMFNSYKTVELELWRI